MELRFLSLGNHFLASPKMAIVETITRIITCPSLGFFLEAKISHHLIQEVAISLISPLIRVQLNKQTS